MKVFQFNLGMGPTIFKKKHKETVYGLKLFPIGGSCVFGEDDELDEERELDPCEFRNKPVWQRIIVISAGAFLNLVLGLILCIVINFINPIASTTVSTFGDTTVLGFEPNAVSNTGETPLMPEDKIMAVDGYEVYTSAGIFDVLDWLLENEDKQVRVLEEDEKREYAEYELIVIREVDGEKAEVKLEQVRFAVFPNSEREGRLSNLKDLSLYAISNSPANPNALKVGDEIISVEGMSIISASEIFYKMDNSLTKTGTDSNFALYEFVVIREGETITLSGVTFTASPNERGGMSYDRDFYVKPVKKDYSSGGAAFGTIGTVLDYSAREFLSLGRIIWLSLMDIIRGTYGLNDISGPVGIAGVVGKVTSQAVDFKQVVMSIVSLAALITINLGIVNLLPIPALDGGRIIFLTVEAIRRKPLKAEVEGVIHFVGFALLMVLIVVVTFNDLRKLIFGI